MARKRKSKENMRFIVDDINKRINIPSKRVRMALDNIKEIIFIMPYREILLFIYERTFRWNKAVEYIPRETFIEGIPGVIPGMLWSSRKIDRAIAYLSQKRFIISFKLCQGKRVSGVAYMLNIPLILSKVPSKNFSSTQKVYSIGLTDLLENYISLKDIAIDCNSKEEEYVATIEAALAESYKKTEEAKKRRLEKKKKRTTSSIIRRVNDILEEQCSMDRGMWTAKTGGMLSNFVKIDHDGEVDAAMAEITKVFTDWSSLRQRALIVYRKGIILTLSPDFESFYKNRKFIRELVSVADVSTGDKVLRKKEKVKEHKILGDRKQRKTAREEQEAQYEEER